MSRLVLTPVDRPEIVSRPISERLRSQLVYFGVPSGSPGVPALGDAEYWFDHVEVTQWLDDGVISLISPLDTAHMTEVELSEEQESLLAWILKQGVRHVRVEGE